MLIESYTKALTQSAAEHGITKLHFHIENIEKRDVMVFNGDVQNICASSESLLLVEGEHNGFAGSAYCEDLNTDNLTKVIDNIIQTASINKQKYVEKPIHNLDEPKNDDVSFDTQKFAEKLLEAERATRIMVNNIEAFRIWLSHTQKTIKLINGHGARMTDKVSFFSINANIMAKDSGQVQTAHYHRIFNDEFSDFKEIAINAAAEACQMLNSKPCASGRYAAVIKNDAFAALFGAFLPAFYAEKCQSKMSFLMSKGDSAIGSTAFSVHEDPNNIIRRRFDDEGTLTAMKCLIDKGKLVNYFHNIHTAASTEKKQKSNGNGFRQNYNEGISSAYTNVVIEVGDKSLDTLLLEMGDGLLITACDGIFAGVNPVSGDFSVISKGYMVRGGVLAEPVSGITIGGSLYDILSAAEDCGRDQITIHGNTGVVTSPSIRLSEIVVTGKI